MRWSSGTARTECRARCAAARRARWLRVLQHFHDLAFGTAAPVGARDARHDAVAVQHLVHLGRTEKEVRAARRRAPGSRSRRDGPARARARDRASSVMQIALRRLRMISPSRSMRGEPLVKRLALLAARCRSSCASSSSATGTPCSFEHSKMSSRLGSGASSLVALARARARRGRRISGFSCGVFVDSFDRARRLRLEFRPHAQVAELVDAPGSGPGGSNGVGVRVPSWAPDFRFEFGDSECSS